MQCGQCRIIREHIEAVCAPCVLPLGHKGPHRDGDGVRWDGPHPWPTAEKHCRARWDANPGATWAWHCSHDRLCEPLTAPASDRIDFIREPEDEQELRWNLFAPLDAALLPPKLIEATRERDEAWRAYVEAGRASDEARRAYVEALIRRGRTMKEAQPELEALHKRLCVPDCPWDGTTIFSEGPP